MWLSGPAAGKRAALKRSLLPLAGHTLFLWRIGNRDVPVPLPLACVLLRVLSLLRLGRPCAAAALVGTWVRLPYWPQQVLQCGIAKATNGFLAPFLLRSAQAGCNWCAAESCWRLYHATAAHACEQCRSGSMSTCQLAPLPKYAFNASSK